MWFCSMLRNLRASWGADGSRFPHVVYELVEKLHNEASGAKESVWQIEIPSLSG